MTIAGLIGIFQGLSAAIVAVFMTTYAWRSKWWGGATGRAMMALAGNLLILLVVGVTRTIWGDYPGVNYVRLASYVIMSGVVSTLLVLLRRAQRRR